MNSVFDKKRMARTLAIALSLSATQADAADEVREKSYHLSVGVGAYAVLNPYDRDKDEPENGPLPYISFKTDRVSIDPTELAVKAIGNNNFAVEALIAPRWLIADPGDIARYSDIERKTGVDAGGRLSAFYDRFKASVEYRGDISGRSNGHEITGTVGAQFDLSSRLNLGVQGGARWRDNSLSTYLYGVFLDEARLGRPAYAIDDTITPFAGIMASYQFTNHLSAVIAAEAEFFPDQVKSSPIVERDFGAQSFMALIYEF